MDKVFNVYATNSNVTVVEYADGNAIHVKETLVEIAGRLNVR